MNTVEAMKGHEQSLITHYGLPPITGTHHYRGECPLCGKKNKFRLHLYNGSVSYICVCSSGSLLSLICEVTGRAFKDIAAEVDRLVGNTFKSNKPILKKCDFKERFLKYDLLRGTQAQTYLNSRGIYELPRRGIRYADFINDSQGVLQGIVAVASDEYHRACYEHITFLDNGAKASVNVQKKMKTISEAHSVSVKLFDPGTCLGIAEGIETALSAQQLYKLPMWSTLNSAFMKKFKAPKGVESLYIMADNDNNGTGLAAAFDCANKNILSNNDVCKVIVRWPEKRGYFNDVICDETEVVEWTLSK